VSRLIRLAFGPFELPPIAECDVKEVPTAELKKALGPEIIRQADADFDAPVETEQPLPARGRHSGAGRRPEPGIQKHGRGKPLDSGSPRSGVRNDSDNRRGPDDERPRKRQHKKRRRADRSGGPRPKYPRAK
jgi:hypothetical protein